ncbi:MAG: YjbQ family protein [Candidatus Moraniibacteriota bacterium]|nr:MAG: YjbQ family protein [Candidatus Moranbacteria bacterium]
MKIETQTIKFETKSQIDFIDITEQVQNIIEKSGVREGIVLVFSSHTTMGVCINHNEPLLLQDFMSMMYRLSPVDNRYNHDLFELKKKIKSDGRSNGHSHCKDLLVGNSETIPIERGVVSLGRWQSIFAVEFDGSRKRDIVVQIMGE